MPKDTPLFIKPEYEQMAEQWEVVRAVSGGTPKMRDKGETFLPKNPLESTDNYKNRLKRVSFFNVFRETKVGMAGMVFRKKAILSDNVPDAIIEHTNDIDFMGNDIHEFAAQIFDEACTMGHVFGFVDFTINTGVASLAEERALGLRPYWVKIPAENILSWRIESVNGRQVINQIVILEIVTLPEGVFTEGDKRRYRVIRPNEFEVWEHVIKDGKELDEVFLAESGANTLGVVPLTIFNFNREGMFTSSPPMLDLAYENISHWQSRSDHRNSLHFSSIAILAIYGRMKTDQGKKIVWAADSVLDLPGTAKAEFLEHKGMALAATRDELVDIEGRMARLGLSFVVEGDPDIKATKLIQDKSESDSKLAKMVIELERGMKQMLDFHQRWLTGEKEADGGAYIPNKDFRDRPLSPEMVGQWVSMVQAGQISIETMWDALVEGDVFPLKFDRELEMEKLEKEITARIRAEGQGMKDEDGDQDED